MKVAPVSASSLQLPHALEAECAVLGAVLRSPNQLDILTSRTRLRPEHFFSDVHRKIFQAFLELDLHNEPVDPITISQKLRKDVTYTFLLELSEKAPLTQNVEHFGKLIREKYFARRVILRCQETAQQAADVDGDVQQFMANVEQEFLDISRERDLSIGLTSAPEVLEATIADLERRIEGGGGVTGVSTGFTDLDHTTSGWQGSDLIILAARPGMGKTALALNWAMNALKSKKESHVAIFTLEMSREQLMQRVLSAEGRIDSTKLRRGDLGVEEQDDLAAAARRMHDLGYRLMIDETPAISVSEVRSRCRRYKKEHGLSMVVIDYLQLMTASDTARKQGREREISEISTNLKAMAKELNVPVIALAQLNRGPDARPDKRPRISDLRESGSMEQDADLILFVYRDEYYNTDSELAGQSEVILAKNRHGETGTVTLAWLPNFVSFHNLIKDDVSSL
ncbi:MAG: replicative DNA helicase [Oligoflexales bacterium]